MAKPGLAAFERRDPKKTGALLVREPAEGLRAGARAVFKADATAWAFFCAQPPGYQRLMTCYVMSAKQHETRARRLARLIKTSAEGKRIR